MSNPAEPTLTGIGWENLSCDDQFALARKIAANIGYVLIPEPEIEPPSKPSFREWFEANRGPYPGQQGERYDIVFQQMADAFAEYVTIIARGQS